MVVLELNVTVPEFILTSVPASGIIPQSQLEAFSHVPSAAPVQLHSLNNVRLGWSFGASRMYDELCQELFSRPPRLFVRIFLTHVSLHGQRWFFLGKAILY